METLLKKTCRIDLNDQGVVKYSIHGRDWKTPAYLVMIKGYSRADPSCRKWDMSEPIVMPMKGDDWVGFVKPVESVEFSCFIKIFDNGWDWKVTVCGKSPRNHRFGIAVPWVEGDLYCLDQKVDTSIGRYTTSLEQVYSDQTLMTLPIATRGDHSIFCSYNQDCQFFFYGDKTQYCRVTSSTSKTTTLMVSYRVNESPAREYVKAYPAAENMVYRWKPEMRALGSRQSVQVIRQPKEDVIERQEGKIYISEPTDAQMDRYSAHLKSAFEKYPDDFLEKIGVSAILLCGKILIRGAAVEPYSATKAAGMMFGRSAGSKRWILLDVSQNDLKVIHHEIYHYLAEYSNQPNDEFHADLFADLMTSPQTGDAAEQFRSQILDACPDIKFAESIVNSNTQIWYLEDGEYKPLTFGNVPVENVDYVSDPNWHKEWHANHNTM